MNATVEQVWSWLGEVPDPEIPVISVVDLGIVRDVAYEGDECVVTITPTYSGCPAMQVIADTVKEALHAHGLSNVRLISRLSPAWTPYVLLSPFVVLFLVLATANSGGYRYGVSDQAFYLPAVSQHLTPGLFPRDSPLLDAQAHLMGSDEIVAGLVRTTGASLPHIAFAFYIVTLIKFGNGMVN